MAIKMGFSFVEYREHILSVDRNHDRKTCVICSEVDAHRAERAEFRAKTLWRTLEITGRMMPMCNNK